MLFAGFALGIQAQAGQKDGLEAQRSHHRHTGCFVFSIPLRSRVGTVKWVSQVNDGSIFVLQ